MNEKKTLSILVPVYNEKKYLEELIQRIAHCPLPPLSHIHAIEVILVDDCSTDGSREWLGSKINALHIQRADSISVFFKLHLHEKNSGKGSAIRSAIKLSTGDFALIQDADLEYTPQDYPRLLQPILSGVADAVFGSRFRGETTRVLFFWHAVGNKLLTLFSNMMTDLNLTDMETCYKAVRGDFIRALPLTSKRFGIEPEITARLARSGARIYEVPIQYFGRTYDEGKKITWKDGAAALWHIFYFNCIDRRTLPQKKLSIAGASKKI